MNRVAKALVVSAFGIYSAGALISAAQSADQLQLGGDPNFRPVSFTNEKNESVGYDIDFGTALCEKLNTKCAYNGLAFDGLIPALLSKRIDAMTTFAVTEKRKEVIAYSQPVLAQRIVLIVPKTNPKDPTLDELKSMSVAAQVNSSAAGTLDKAGIKSTSYSSLADEMSDLALGRIDAVAVEGIAGYYAVAATYPDKLRVSTVLSTTPVYIAVALRKEDTALMEKVNKAITQMKSDGTLEKITKKWFGDADIIAK
jgi:ABC-type amino acid transport substrate-binding protein